MTYKAGFYTDYRRAVGQLGVDGPCRKEGKLAFTWQFHAAGSRKVDAIEVKVMAVQDEAGLAFKAVCPRLPVARRDTDINRLHQVVEADLIDQVFAMTGIVWTDWYEVVVKGDDSTFDDSQYSAMGANLHVQVNPLKRGIHPTTGLPMTINGNNMVVPFPQPTKIGAAPDEGELFEGFGRMSFRGPDAERSYIPATPENQRALQEVLARMALLRKSLADVLSQEKVAAQLSAIDQLTLPLLAGPTDLTS